MTADEYQRVDKAYSGNLDQAMDRAGFAVAVAAVRMGAGYGSKVAVLTGPGNNGGDGYVAARYLHRRGVAVVVRAIAPPYTPESGRAAEYARQAGGPVVELGPATPVDLVVDALFGGGARGGFSADVLSWMGTAAPVLAVDYPTGLDPNTGAVEDNSFNANETITFQTLKTGHVRGRGPDVCGLLTVVDIGIEGGEASMWVAEEIDAPRPVRPRTAHKWSAGSVLVIGGSTGMVGASVLAGQAALGFGAGSVLVASPRADLVTAAAPQLLTRPLDQGGGELDRFDVVIAGPGLAYDDRELAIPVLRKSQKVLLDAGALDPLLVDAAVEGGAEVILTPHAREFARLTSVGGGAFSTRAYAGTSGVTLLLKGNPTLVTDGSAPILVRTGGPELATIGTGDVLAGMIAALWARGLQPLQAAVAGAYWHGIAGGDLARSESVTSSRLAEHIRRFTFPDRLGSSS